MKAIILNPSQSADIESLLILAQATGGTVFALVNGAPLADQEMPVAFCHCIPGESSHRLRVFLEKEALRGTSPNLSDEENAHGGHGK